VATRDGHHGCVEVELFPDDIDPEAVEGGALPAEGTNDAAGKEMERTAGPTGVNAAGTPIAYRCWRPVPQRTIQRESYPLLPGLPVPLEVNTILWQR